MRISMRLVLAAMALALVSGTASASHSETDTYYAPTGAATVAHLAGGCAGPEHTGGACFTQYEEGDDVTIVWTDAVVPQTGAIIAFRPGSGSDLLRVPLCLNAGVATGPYTVPVGTARIVVFLGSLVDTTTNTPVCPGAPQPTTGTVTATYAS